MDDACILTCVDLTVHTFLEMAIGYYSYNLLN